MTIETMIAAKFGTSIDPLAGVAAEDIDEARRVVSLWTDAGRADLRALAKLVRDEACGTRTNLPAWKRAVLARTLALRVLNSTGRQREAALVGLGAVDPEFDRRAMV